LEELEKGTNVFGIGARMPGVPENTDNSDIYKTRLHPCCALIKNTEVFRRIVEEIGLSCVEQLWGNGKEYLDTFKLMTKVMKTHKLRHIISSKTVIHFFTVSYVWMDSKKYEEEKTNKRDKLLKKFRDK
jgi:hypothetical protein